MEIIFIYLLLCPTVILILYAIKKCLVFIYNTLIGNYRYIYIYIFEEWFWPFNIFKFWEINYDKNNVIHWFIVRLFFPFVFGLLYPFIGIVSYSAMLNFLYLGAFSN